MTVLHPKKSLDGNAEDGDEDADVKADDDGNAATNETEDGNGEAVEETANNGQDSDNEGAENLAIAEDEQIGKQAEAKRCTYPTVARRGMIKPMTATPATLRTAPRAPKIS